MLYSILCSQTPLSQVEKTSSQLPQSAKKTRDAIIKQLATNYQKQEDGQLKMLQQLTKGEAVNARRAEITLVHRSVIIYRRGFHHEEIF